MNQKKYLMSFTTGGLFHTESLLLLEIYLKTQNWDDVYQYSLDNNTLQTRVVSTAKRVLKEIINRLKTLTDDELRLLENGSTSEQKYLLWLSTCRRYTFLHDFATEVIRERYLTLKYDLPVEEYEGFYNSKEQWHEELEKITEGSRYKQRTVVFKILREADIIDANKLILPAILTDELISIIAKKDASDLAIFPVSDIDLQRAV
ncbi:Putative inner membrane protein [Epsilonproteobacteria bacterium SCGC AD-308-P11]|nr:Putative inner membrane protein [Epsilonproteobacteria bacterium SCGC AD-308-P11]